MTKIMDLHCDTISRIRSRRNEGHICGLQDNHFHVDLKRMKEAGYSLQTFALFTDAAEEESPFFASMELLDIFREEMKLAGLDRTTSQFFAVLTDLRSVGVMGDERTYDYTLALRAVQSQDFMTATWSRLPYELLDKVSGRIVGEVKHINRICYDITSKPPATVEWE